MGMPQKTMTPPHSETIIQININMGVPNPTLMEGKDGLVNRQTRLKTLPSFILRS